MTIVYIAGVVSAAVVVGILVYLYRESQALERQREQAAQPNAAAEGQPEAVPEAPASPPEEAEPVEVEPGSDENDEHTADQP